VGKWREMGERWREALLRRAPGERRRMLPLMMINGAACGIAAVAFHSTILTLYKYLLYPMEDDATHGLLWLAVALPIVGALVVGVVACKWAPGAMGSGIPQVKKAYAQDHGRVSTRDAVGKFVLGAVQIGTGSSLGFEGPTVQICAGVSTAVARLGRLSPKNMRRMTPVGAAAGIAAAFNAPLAGVTFAIEEIIGSLDNTMLFGVVVAAAIAAAVEQSILGGSHTLFKAGTLSYQASAWSMIGYALLGVAAGVAAVSFTGLLLWVRARVSASRLPVWLRPALGAATSGVIAAAGIYWLHGGGILGGGARGLTKALTGGLALEVMAALCVMKLIATAMSSGTGGAGGIFLPSLFMGAMLGGAMGGLDVRWFHGPADAAQAFALVGMGAVFAGVVRAPITSILLVIEICGGYALALPLMVANMTAYALARRLQPESLYEALLRAPNAQAGEPGA